MDKTSIRQQMKQARLDLSRKEYLDLSNLIISKIKKHSYYLQANTIGIYVSFHQEVHTMPFIQEMLIEKNVCIPKIEYKKMQFHQINSLESLKKNSFGILEPENENTVNKEQIDLLIVPIVAFDKFNNRIGYGGGYYDRYLADYRGKTIGIAFSFQEIKEIIPEPYDCPLDIVIHENS